MRYLLVYEIKDPIDENLKKILEIEKGRIDKGEDWSKDAIFPQHTFLSGKPGGFHLVETDDNAKVGKWITDYMATMKLQVTPIMERPS